MKVFSKDYWSAWLEKFFRLPISRTVWLIVLLAIFKWKDIIGDWAFVSGLGLIFGSSKYKQVREIEMNNHGGYKNDKEGSPVH